MHGTERYDQDEAKGVKSEKQHHLCGLSKRVPFAKPQMSRKLRVFMEAPAREEAEACAMGPVSPAWGQGLLSEAELEASQPGSPATLGL